MRMGKHYIFPLSYININLQTEQKSCDEFKIPINTLHNTDKRHISKQEIYRSCGKHGKSFKNYKK